MLALLARSKDNVKPASLPEGLYGCLVLQAGCAPVVPTPGVPGRPKPRGLFVQIQELHHHQKPVTALAFDRSLEYLASCAEDSTVVVRIPADYS